MARAKLLKKKVWRMSDFQEAAQEAVNPCFVRLQEIALHGDDKHALVAIREIFDRAFGKAGQPIEITGKAGGPVEIELPERIRELIEAVLP
jgi:hypothetical protein